MKYVTKPFGVELVSDGPDLGAPLRSSEDVFRYARSIYQSLDADKEHFLLIVQNNKNRAVGHKVIATGSLTASLVHPREVYTAVVNSEWRPVIFVHNHPSGDPKPSQEDIELARRLKEIADLFGIRLNDHVILGTDRYYSFSDRGTCEASTLLFQFRQATALAFLFRWKIAAASGD
jgi:DNA repair protein RadC